MSLCWFFLRYEVDFDFTAEGPDFWVFWACTAIFGCSLVLLFKLMRKPPVNLLLLTLVTIIPGILTGTLLVWIDQYVKYII